MTSSVKRSAIVPYSAHAMFTLVADIDSYPQFLPWCGGARTLSKEQDIVKAVIVIAYKGVHKEFTTRNLLQQDKMMELRLLEGPFKNLHGYWRFDALGDDACKISLDLEFEFSNRLLNMAVGPVFEYITNSLVDSFHARAIALYGKR